MDDVGAEVTWSHADEVATISIKGRTRLNVLNSATIAAVTAAAHEASAGDDLRCIVLEGADGAPFVGGADIEEMSALSAVSARSFITALHGLCEAIRLAPVPVIAKVRRYALGGGMELAMACDIRVAERTARWGMPEVRVGLPSVIEAALLPRLVGWGPAANLLFRGQIISGPDAYRIGLVDELVEADELDAAVDQVVRDILRTGPIASKLQKRLMHVWANATLDESIAAGIETFAEAFATDEPEEGLTAFLEKRDARYVRDD